MTRPAIYFSSPSSAADEGPVRSLKTKNHTAPSHLLPTQLVSAVLLDGNAGTKVPAEVSDDMDRHIADMAAKAVQARHDGDAHGAAIYIRRMVKAIRLQIDAARHIDADPCYFSAMGEQAAAQRIAP